MKQKWEQTLFCTLLLYYFWEGRKEGGGGWRGLAKSGKKTDVI